MEEKKKETYQGLVCYLETGKCAETEITALNEGEVLHVFERLAVVTCQTQTTSLTLEELVELATSLTGESEQYTEIMQRLQPFAPSFLKSLLQKIIRFRPSTVEGIRADVYLLATFTSLYTHAGAFVPDIQRFVSGRESALKRLAVSIMEDSSISSFSPLHSLLSAALLARQGVTYNPSLELMKSWMKAALQALSSTQYYNYDTHSNEVLEKCQGLNALLSAIGSFQTDISMASTIRSKSAAKPLQSEEMSLAHAVDQHCYTDFAWFVDMRVKSYEELFKLTWENVSCLNPRKKQTIDENIFSSISKAQTLFLASKEVTPTERKVIEGSYDFFITLDDAYLAALIGICEYKSSYTVLVPNNIYEFNAVKRPARGQETHHLTEEEYKATVENLKERLEEGYPVKDSLVTKVIFDKEKYHVFDKEGKKHKWNNFKHQQFSFPLHKPMEKTLEKAILTCGNGVEQGADQFLGELFKFPQVVERALVYLEGCKKHIVPYKIGRDGKGTEYSVSVLDTAVYQFLAQLALLYPAALQHCSKSGFLVQHTYLFAHVVEMIKDHQKTLQEYGSWELPKKETRALYDHQKMALGGLKERNIIWMAPGMGKTAIVTSHIARLIEEEKMPKYCIYTAPPSALETVLSEFEHRGIATFVMRNGTDVIRSGVVTVIPHDRLRIVIPALRKKINSAFLVVDELHKTLNATQRTSSALELATLAHSFIAMTGTLYKDNKIENLLVWLQLLCSFEVTPKNYWVAVSGCISIRCNTTIKVVRTVKEEAFNEEEKEEYSSVTPSLLGGEAPNLDFKAAVNISYQAITRGIIKEVLNRQKRGEGCFVVARQAAHAVELKVLLEEQNLRVEIINSKNALSLTPADKDTAPQVVITTSTHCEGYDMTVYKTMISGVYFSNEATREQLERRINRLSQDAEEIEIVLIHAGIISYVHEKYEGVRSMAGALKGFAKEAGVEIEY